MQDASINDEIQSSAVNEDPNVLVNRLRGWLLKAQAKELEGDQWGAFHARERADELLQKLEESQYKSIVIRAERAFGSVAHPYFDDAVIAMLGVLRHHATSLDAKSKGFGSAFATCFKNRCINAIRDVCRENALIGKNSPGKAGLKGVSADAPVPGGGGATFGELLPDAKSLPDPHGRAGATFTEEIIENAINALPPDLEAVVRSYQELESYDEVGKALGISSKTASARHTQALHHVRLALQP